MLNKDSLSSKGACMTHAHKCRSPVGFVIQQTAHSGPEHRAHADASDVQESSMSRTTYSLPARYMNTMLTCVQCFCSSLGAGPATSEQLVMLDLCVDALKATATISSSRMQALDSALHTLRTLIQLKAAITQAGQPPCFCLTHAR